MKSFNLILLASATLSLGCPSKDSDPSPSGTDSGTNPDDTGSADDTGDPSTTLDACERLGLPAMDFNPEGSSLPLRHNPAGDFSVPLVDGSEWVLSEQWSGCESYIFLPHWLPVDDLDSRSWWAEGVGGLIEKSPPNAHYFFVVAGSPDDASTYIEMIADDIDENLIAMGADDRAWWGERLHVVSSPSHSLEGAIKMAFQGNIGTMGMAIDRFQQFRTLGSMAAVEEYDSNLADNDLWPYERRIYEAGYQPEYYNFEAERQARLDAEDAVVIEVLGGDVVSQFADGTLVLPENIHEFDTLEIDVIMECPNSSAYELGNCGPWDYLAHMWLQVEIDPESKDGHSDSDGADSGEADTGTEDTGDVPDEVEDTGDVPDEVEDTGDVPDEPEEPGPTTEWWEMSRFITTYHRESRWIVDASHALAWLQAGGERTVRYEWAPAWNVQPTAVTTRFRFSNRGKGSRAVETVHLFSGGNLNTSYNTREPVAVDIPADVTKVEFVAITTGHGMATSNCAEFCDHSHHFTVNGTEHTQNLDDPGLLSGCAEKVNLGVVPNQAGTWWYGRGGWCPGQEVTPFVVDVTSETPPGETSTVSYEARINGSAPFDNAGNIVLNSWLVYYR